MSWRLKRTVQREKGKTREEVGTEACENAGKTFERLYREKKTGKWGGVNDE